MTWLLLRGLTRDQRHWGSFATAFSEAVGDEVVCLDPPGFGTESGRPSPASIAAITDDLRRRLPARREWSILGISLGGMVTLDWCARYPQDFARAVVVNTSAADVGSPLARFSPTAMGLVARKLRDPVAAEHAAIRIASNLPDVEALGDQWSAWYAENPPHRGSPLRQARAAGSFKLPAAVHLPLLVLSSKGDRMVSHRCSEAIASRLGAELRVHETAGHDLPLDDPGWVGETVSEWLRSS